MAKRSRKLRGSHEEYCWVRSGESIVHVTQYAGVPKAARGRLECPVCGDEAVLHLGRRNAHHYQHKNGLHQCPLSVGETAKHFNAKYHLAKILEAISRVHVAVRCGGITKSSPCVETISEVWLEAWDNVQVEASVDPLRPDVLLRRGDTPVGAVEVRVTHGVTQEKAALFQQLGVSWIEVDADSALRWAADLPLDILSGSLCADWLCSEHLLAAKTEEARQAAHKEAEREAIRLFALRRQLISQGVSAQELDTVVATLERERCAPPTVRFLVLDAVYRSGAVLRYVFRVTRDPDSSAAILSCDQSSSYRVYAGGPASRDTLNDFGHHALNWMLELKRWDGASRIETPATQWLNPVRMSPVDAVPRSRWPSRFFYDESNHVWVSITTTDGVE
jgi:hypothetical protein